MIDGDDTPGVLGMIQGWGGGLERVRGWGGSTTGPEMCPEAGSWAGPIRGTGVGPDAGLGADLWAGQGMGPEVGPGQGQGLRIGPWMPCAVHACIRQNRFTQIQGKGSWGSEPKYPPPR